MLSHQLWVDAGKPRNGTIFQKRTRDKLAHRALIKERKESEKTSISNELHDLLLNKNTNSFWNTWKHKVCATSNVLPCIDGSYDDSINCEQFKNYFAPICTPNSKEYDQKMK